MFSKSPTRLSEPQRESSTSQIKYRLIANANMYIRSEIMEWLETHTDYDIVQLAHERNIFSIEAITHGMLINIKNGAARSDVIKKICDACIMVAKENDIQALDILLTNTFHFVPDDVAAYAIGLVYAKQGWAWNIERIEKLLDGIRKHLVGLSGKNGTFQDLCESLNNIADAGVKGFLEVKGHEIENKSDVAWLLSLIKDPLLFQKFSDKTQELGIELGDIKALSDDKPTSPRIN